MESTVVTLDHETTADMSYTKTEIYDVEFARQILNDKAIPKEDRDTLRRYVKSSVRGNRHETTYKLGKNCKHTFMGRLIALKGEGLQCVTREIRNAIASQYYHDIDMVNAQPTLLHQYCEKQGWKCDAIKTYVQNREELMSEVCETFNIQRWEVKERIISLFFGSMDTSGLTSFFSDELLPELRRIMENNYKVNSSELKWLDKQPNRVGKALAYVLQTEERKCLLAMDRSLTRYGRSLDVYIHDGGLVAKKEGETTFPSELLRKVEVDVLKETGYTIHLLSKPMKSSLVKMDMEDDYQEKKEQWEVTGWKDATFFKLRNPPSFAMVYKDKISLMTKKDIVQNEEDNLCLDGNLFIKRWLEDPAKKEYNSIVFNPKGDSPSSVYNLFNGFKVKSTLGADISKIHDVVRLLANNDPKMQWYIERWVAHMFQKPWIKSRVCLVVVGDQGVGKDTYFDFIGQLLGHAEGYFHNTSTPENDVFSRFNNSIQRAILIKFEEANFKTNKANADALKSLITSDVQRIEQKGKDTITLDSFSNIVMTTNHDVPILIENGDRRFVMTQASSERKGDSVYWNTLYTELNKQDVKEAYVHYLMNLDLTDFDPARDRVVSEAYTDAKACFTPYHATWFQCEIETRNQLDVSFVYTARDLFNLMKGSKYNDLRETRFGRDMKLYIDGGCIIKKRSNTSIEYHVYPMTTKAFLEKQGWWVEL